MVEGLSFQGSIVVKGLTVVQGLSLRLRLRLLHIFCATKKAVLKIVFADSVLRESHFRYLHLRTRSSLQTCWPCLVLDQGMALVTMFGVSFRLSLREVARVKKA